MARYIDADKMREDWLENGENEYVYDTNAVLDSIDAQPTADVVEVRHGYWENRYNEEYKYRCSLCDGGSDRCSDYCPNCGAIMENKDEEQ